MDDCLGPTPFDVFDIHRGRSRNIAKQDFESSGAESTGIPVVGKFKGLINVSAPALTYILDELKKKKVNDIVDMLEEMYALKYGRGSDIDFDCL